MRLFQLSSCVSKSRSSSLPTLPRSVSHLVLYFRVQGFFRVQLGFSLGFRGQLGFSLGLGQGLIQVQGFRVCLTFTSSVNKCKATSREKNTMLFLFLECVCLHMLQVSCLFSLSDFCSFYLILIPHTFGLSLSCNCSVGIVSCYVCSICYISNIFLLF